MSANDKVISMEDKKVDSALRAMSTMLDRMTLAQTAGIQYDGQRDLYAIFGYPKEVTPVQLLAKYRRQDIASRVVDAPPGATWSGPPELKEGNPLGESWETLVTDNELKLVPAFYRADRLARLNTFSLLLFGFDDGAALDRKPSKVSSLLYARPIPARQVTDIVFNKDPRNPRYGMPETYKIQFDDPLTKSGTGMGTTSSGIKDLVVHWSRCVHIVEFPLEDPIYGIPILEKVYNQLDDLLKVGGGTSEMYWLAGNKGMQADIDKEMEIDPADAAALTDEIEEWQHSLRRFIRTRGVKLTDLGGTPPNPKETFEMIIAIISGTTGIPRRILIGSEAGQLASEQDRANWAERIEERRVLFVEPEILNPTILCLQRVGLMPEGTPEWWWPSAFIQNPLEEGQTMAQIARAVGNMSRQTGATTPMQLLSEKECREVLAPLMRLENDVIPDSERYVLPPYIIEQTAARSSSGPGGPKEESEEGAEKRSEKKDDNQTADNQA